LSGVNTAPPYQFTVSIGVELPAATVQNIAQAIQKCVLVELAGAQLNAPLAIDFLTGTQPPVGVQATAEALKWPDGTQGITIDPR